MADPVVHITAGIPDSGTGNITTLGQTLLDGANLTLGAVADAAASGAGTVNAHLRSIATSVAGTLTITGTVATSGTSTITGTVTANQGGTWTVQPGNTANTTAWLVTGTGGTFPVTGTVTANQGGAPWTMRPDGTLWTQTGTSANVNVTNASIAVTGTFFQATQPVSIAAAVNTNASQSGTWTVQQGTPPWAIAGDVASGSADSGNPIKVGGVARTANPTAVAAGQRVNAMFDKLGKQVVVSGLREAKGVQKTSISVGTETTVVTAGAAGVFNDVYAIIVTNKSATPVFVDFRDATAGTVRATIAAPANDTRGLTLTVDSAIIQAVAANNWTATVSSAVSSIEISMLYVSNL